MNDSNPKNIVASIHQRILNKARTSNLPFQELLQYYAMERLLYRLFQSSHGNNFFLKGALMFTAWGKDLFRSTKDIDLLGRTNHSVENLESIFKDICLMDSHHQDGMIFDATSVKGYVTQHISKYEGVQLSFKSMLGKANVPIRIDIGFSDLIYPKPQVLIYPTILDLPAPIIQGYTPETVIAEKFETMVKLGLKNSRMKDFLDIWALSRQFSFQGRILSEALRSIFLNRNTPLASQPFALTEAFAYSNEKQTQWKVFLRQNQIDHAPQHLSNIIHQLNVFLVPMLETIVSQQVFDKMWTPPGPWSY